jgi:hypothetical protein
MHLHGRARHDVRVHTARCSRNNIQYLYFLNFGLYMDQTWSSFFEL